MALTNAEHQRRWRERQAGRLPPVERPYCTACGKVHRAGSAPHQRARRLTPNGSSVPSAASVTDCELAALMVVTP
jgi:hypothetical protein